MKLNRKGFSAIYAEQGFYMKIMQRSLIALLLVALLLPTAYAIPLSPALEHIAAKETMIKTGNSYAGVQFEKQDFINASGVANVGSLTVRSLPHPSVGVLYFGSVPVAINQTVSGENIENLKFIPAAETESASFHFSVNDGSTRMCTMILTDDINFAPTLLDVDAVAAWTSRDIRCYGTLGAYDPEGDRLRYEIVDYPKKGLLQLTDEEHGDFQYTPYVNCSGSDTFTYRVSDAFGNYSETGKATVVISRQNTKLVFADMTDHWAHSAAIVMAEKGVMEYDVQNNLPVFSPDETVTREEFLLMVMKVLGVDDPGECAQTVFADDGSIDVDIKPYVQAAYRAGIIRGREVDGALCFCPKEPITRAETAVVLNNIIGAEVPVNAVPFSDNDIIPTWAQGALYALNDLGILRGTGAGSISPFSVMSKAQAAQILFNLMKYVE